MNSITDILSRVVIDLGKEVLDHPGVQVLVRLQILDQLVEVDLSFHGDDEISPQFQTWLCRNLTRNDPPPNDGDNSGRGRRRRNLDLKHVGLHTANHVGFGGRDVLNDN